MTQTPATLLEAVWQSLALTARYNSSDATAPAVLLKDQSGLTGREIAQRLGLADGSGLGNLLRVAEEYIAKNRSLRRVVKKLSSMYELVHY